MRILLGHDEAVGKFVAGLAPIEKPIWPSGFSTFGVIRDDGALVAGVVFSDWRKDFLTVELSGASLSRHAFSPQILATIGEYAFGQLGAFRVWARTSVENKAARGFLRHIGFIEESVSAHHYGPKRHAITLRIIEPQWRHRWEKKKIQKAA